MIGLHICYDLHLPGDMPEADVRARVEQLHACAGALPFEKVSPVVWIEAQMRHDEAAGGGPRV